MVAEETGAEYRYWAFISYSHKNAAHARWLHRAIEGYGIPTKLVEHGHATPLGEPAPKRFRPVFRDSDELSAASSLDGALGQALRASRYLIVLCSPQAAQSNYVNEEVTRFRELGRAGRVFAYIVDGEPNSGDERECFPPALREPEPLAADARRQGDGRSAAKLKLLAAMLGVGYDELRRRDDQRRQRFWMRLTAGALALVVVFALMAGYANNRRLDANRARQTAVQEAQARATAQVQAQAAATLEASARQEAECQARQARAGELVARAQRELASDGYDPSRALLLACEAVDATRLTDGYVTPDAVSVLRRAVDAAPPYVMTLPRWSHTDTVYSAAFSPNGRTVVSASADGTARIWDAETGQQRLLLQGHTGAVFSAVYSPDGSMVVTASEDDTVRIWDASTGAEVRQLIGHLDDVRSAAFAPDEQTIVTASDDRTARIWDVATGHELLLLCGHEDVVSHAAYAPDGRTVATSSPDGTVRIWDATTGRELQRIAAGRTSSALFTPQTAEVVTMFAGSVRFWDPTSGAELRRLSLKEVAVEDTASLSPDGGRIVTAHFSSAFRIWDAATGELLLERKAHWGQVASAAFSPDGATVVTAGYDMTVRIWDAVTGQLLRLMGGHDSPVTSVDYAPDGESLATLSSNGTICVWAAATGELLRQFTGPRNAFAIRYDPTGRLIVITREDTAVVLDAATGQDVVQFLGHTGSVRTAEFSPDGTTVVTASGDGTARIWDAATGRELMRLAGHTGAQSPMDTWGVGEAGRGGVNCAVYSPDGRTIVTAGDDMTARIWDARTGKELRQLIGHEGQVGCAAYSPHGSYIVTTSGDQTVRIWDAETGEQVGQLEGDTRVAVEAEFSPDGEHIATAHGWTAESPDWYEAKVGRVWSSRTGELECELIGHADQVSAVTYSPDGRHIATGSADHTCRVWDSESGALRRELVRSFGWSPDIREASFGQTGETVVAAQSYGGLGIWDVATGEFIKEISESSSWGDKPAVSAADGSIATANWSDSSPGMDIWDASAGVLLHEFPTWSHVNCLAYSLDGLYLISGHGGYDENPARIWNAQTGALILQLVGHTSMVTSVAFSSDGSRVATASDDRTARIWDTRSGRLQRILTGHTEGLTRACFSPDGKYVLTASLDGTTRVWDASSGQQVLKLEHPGYVSDAAYSPDGKTIATACRDGIARLWDAETGQQLVELVGHTDFIYSIDYSPDGRLIVTASADGTARIWIANIDDLLAEAVRLIQRDPPILTPEERERYGFSPKTRGRKPCG